MNKRTLPVYPWFLILCTCLCFVPLFIPRSLAHRQTQNPVAGRSREDAYRANNLGVALLEQFKYKEAADAFKRALQIDPKLALGHINLCVALYNVPDLPGSQREAQAAIALTPNAPQPYYILGLIAKTQSRPDDAIASFQSDVTSGAGIPSYPYLPGSVAFVDVDHDGDLDVFIAGLADLSKTPKVDEPVFPNDFAGAPNMLLRNDGNGKFTDITVAAKLDTIGHALAIVPTDFNNRRDIDLLILEYGMAPALFSNQRDGTFRNVAGEVGLGTAGNWSCVAAGDLNKDGYTDLFFGRSDEAVSLPT